jgi:DNA-binding transcriptional regulator/RsmH inhibitor MraZ
VSAYQKMAGSIASGSTGSLNKLEQQMRSLTTSGPVSNAFKRLVVYVTTKCTPPE